MSINMEKKVHSERNSDRISSLPEPIREHILSFLPTRDAVKASILSSSWRALWMDLPTLDFGRFQLSRSLTVENLPSSDEDDGARVRRESIIKKREQFYDFLDRAFHSISKLEMLTLYLPQYDSELKSRLDHWLDCVVGCRVKKLKLQIGKSEAPRYSLPKSVLGVNSITKLELQGCELNSASLVNTQLPSVQKLSLGCVYLDEKIMESIPVSFPNLEAFTFKNCYGLTRLEVSGLTKLEEVDIEHYSDDFEAIVIDAPNLLQFTYVYEGDLYEFFQSSDIEVSGCKNLKCLKLVGAIMDDFDFHMLLDVLPVLEKLFLYQCNNLQDICVSSQSLVQLEFEHCLGLLTAALYTPNLKIFHYAEDDPITFTGKGKGSVFKLTKASVYLKPDIKVDKWYVNLIKFLAKLGNCEQFSICVGFEEDLTIPEKVRMKSRPPLRGVKHLMVELRASFKKHTRVEFVEALLWLAPSPESISIHNGFIPVCKVLEFTYEKQPKGRKKCGCWKSPAIICWRHALDKVSLENRKGDEDDTRLANFFSKARIDGKMVCFVKKAGPIKK